MNLRQLQYVCEVARLGLSVTAAAECLHTSQPGVSKQIRLLEEELGIEIFARGGKYLSHITPAGQAVLECANRVLREADNMKRVAADFRDPHRGTLSIATTHTQARYALPEVVYSFRQLYPEVSLQIHQGGPKQMAEQVASGFADLAIATEALELFQDLVLLPCYRWNRCIVVPPDHPLVYENPLCLQEIARYPVITYEFGLAGRSQTNAAFAAEGLEPNVVLSATDAEVIKTYVRSGLGIGIIAWMAYSPERDGDLPVLDASHLFEYSITSIALRRGETLRSYIHSFIRLFAPHLTEDFVNAAISAISEEQRSELFNLQLAHLGTR